MNAFVAARIDGSQANELWRTSKMLADSASPLLYQNVLYLLRNGGILSSVDADTGQVIRQERVPGLEGTVFASPVAASGKIYLVSAAGKLAVIAAAREWQLLKVNNLQENCYATPALVEGKILVRGEHSLWAFSSEPKHLQAGTAEQSPGR
jgi:outer membrane protein assembly factor BamB